MELLHVLIPAGPPQLHCSSGIIFIYKFIERSSIPQVESGIDSHVNIFGTSYEVVALQKTV